MRPPPFALLLLTTLVVGCGSSGPAASEANKELVRRFVAAMNAGDWDGLDTLVAEDFRRHSRATTEMPELTSRDAFVQLQRSFLGAFPDQRVTIEMLVAEGDMVATYATYAGTHSGPIGDIPATGQRVEVPFIGILRIAGGRIAEMWVEWDNVTMLTQLGLFPPPGAPGP